ncbi:MAG: hypothetical protein ACLRX4_03295 [Oscillospiraceae bacterium]
MWFWLSLIALLCWSGSDLFSKIGCRDEDDRLSHLKMVMAVGVVMGLHAAFEIFVGGTEISFSIILTYLPVSLLYIGSMTLGYLGLRYIELSVSSPICNSSGALVAVMTLVFLGGEDYSPLAIFCRAARVRRRHRSRRGGRDRGPRAARGASGRGQPQVRQELSCPRAAGGLLPARRGGHLCGQPRDRNADRAGL